MRHARRGLTRLSAGHHGFLPCRHSGEALVPFYWISFRVANEQVGGRTYDQRLENLKDAIDDMSNGYWDETSSFYVIESEKTPAQVATALSAAIAPAADLILMRRLDGPDGYLIGKYKDDEVPGMRAYLKNL
jgi:hypothetical protein